MELQRYRSHRYKSRSYGSEIQSRLKPDASIELGTIGITNEIQAVHGDWRTLRGSGR